jgi:hypothetical protein
MGPGAWLEDSQARFPLPPPDKLCTVACCRSGGCGGTCTVLHDSATAPSRRTDREHDRQVTNGQAEAEVKIPSRPGDEGTIPYSIPGT